jgi:serine/threonine protein kinase
VQAAQAAQEVQEVQGVQEVQEMQTHANMEQEDQRQKREGYKPQLETQAEDLAQVLAAKGFADLAKAVSLDEMLQLAMNAAAAGNFEALRLAIEQAKQEAHDHDFSANKNLKLLKSAKKMLKSLTQPEPAVAAPASSTPSPAPSPAALATSKAAVFSSPKTVGSLTYDLHSVLGEGSCETKVYRGRHSDGREVAVKVMKKAVVPEHRARREMQLLQELAEGTGRGRDHVIQYRCLEEAEGKMLLGMELCECSLHDVISVQHHQIPLAQQIRIVRELSEAVAFLHAHQIVHRDVRPKNILFKQGGYEGIVKLTDFGLSKAVNTTNLDKSFSATTVQAGTEIGSFGYYAPEVYRRGTLTPKVDVFSLGCCMFYVLSHGGNPFQDKHEPDNKFLLNNNILSGTSNLAQIARLPDAVDLLASMIDIEAKVRPSAAHVLEHVLFWSDEKRFQFLCAVGKEDDVASNSPVARAALPPCLLPKQAWSDAIDRRVWQHYTMGEQARTYYDTSSATHLLRFLRNCEAHPPPQDSPAQAVLEAHGGMASYFGGSSGGGGCFPQLLMVVHGALARAGWGSRKSLKRWLPAAGVLLAGATSRSRFKPSAVAGAGAGASLGVSTKGLDVSPSSDVGGAIVAAPATSAAPAALVAPAVSPSVLQQPPATWTAKLVAEWLGNIGKAYAEYGDAFIENGIDGEELLGDEFGKELEELGVASKMHQRRVIKEIQKLKR